LDTRVSAGYTQTQIRGLVLDGTNGMDTFLGLWRMIEGLVKVLSVRKGEGKLFCWLTLLGMYRVSPPMWRRTANKIFI
jgi:hypothetical protein